MAERVRNFDWSTTPLGAIETWPQSLKTATAMVLLSPVPIVTLWGEDGIMIYNDSYSEFAGQRHPSLLGSKVREGWPEVADFNDNIMKVGLAGGTLAYREHQLSLNRTGTFEAVWLDLDYSPILDDCGKPAGVMAIVVDITKRVFAERAQQQANERLRLATENAEVGLWDIDRDGNISFFYARDTFSMPQDRKTPAEEFFAHIHPDDVDRVMETYFAARDPAKRAMLDAEYRTLAMPSIPARWMAVKGRGVFDADGNCVRMSGTAVDITKRRQAEEALRHSEEQLRLATENAEIGMWDMDVVHNVNFSTPRVKRLFGIAEADDPPPEDFFKLVHPDDVARVEQAFASAFDPELRVGYDVEYRVIGRDDGMLRWVHAKGRGVFDRDGNCLRVTGTAIDITARKEIERRLTELNETLEARVGERTAALERSQQALQQAQKMEAIGNLTGGIAHDFNNLLQGVTGSLDLIRRHPQDLERVRRWAEAGLQAAERGAKLTAQLLAFSRSQKLELKPIDLCALLMGMDDLLSRTLGPAVRVSIEPHAQHATVMGDETQLELAVLNLAINARDAMPGGGELVIATRLRGDEGDPELAPGDYVELTVSDIGSGMASEVLARAFDPFFTTKGVGEGTGLGLSQVYGMARQAGGLARIASSPGKGTTVSIFLRSTAAQAAQQPHDNLGAAKPPMSATILVVDDDPDVRRFLSDSLDSLGYAAIEAEDGRAGLDAVSRGAPDLMIVDYAMPGMTGAEVAHRVRALHPALPILFASGYAETSAIENVADDATLILRKPFRISELQDAVARALKKS